jgi:hypothetical protein
MGDQLNEQSIEEIERVVQRIESTLGVKVHESEPGTKYHFGDGEKWNGISFTIFPKDRRVEVLIETPSKPKLKLQLTNYSDIIFGSGSVEFRSDYIMTQHLLEGNRATRILISTDDGIEMNGNSA